MHVLCILGSNYNLSIAMPKSLFLINILGAQSSLFLIEIYEILIDNVVQISLVTNAEYCSSNEKSVHR